MIYSGKRVVILGLGRQGVALSRYLAEQGARVTVSDVQPAEKLSAPLSALADLTIEYVLGGHPESLLEDCDLLCLSGGVDAAIPLAQQARARGIPLSNDSQIFLEVCPTTHTVGITGSAGKTTTTTLVGRMLSLAPRLFLPRGAGKQVWVGGNIGNPLIADVARMAPDDLVVMELSSFQLEIMTRSTQVAAILNITPNHLDRHGTMEAYIAAKSNLLRYQPHDGVAVLGWDNAVTRSLTVQAGRTAYFSAEAEIAGFDGAFLRGETLVWRWGGNEHAVCTLRDIRLRGRHNVLNVLAAIAISGAALALAGAEASTLPEGMRAVINNFTGVEHRLELVHERDGVRWYNDSIASAPERVIAALNAFEEPAVLLLGGRDKKLPWDELARLVKARVRHSVLFGEAGPLIDRALAAAGVPAAQRTLTGSLRDAVAIAAAQARPGDVVLLSPGCTSFDEFRDFAERGEKFREWVRAL
ncbi:MAG: UDP-N-acetylmuramoyl-L-alanine--D-glutamate ligase [Anaerolineales bacterium]|nr:UDP-N-acetylmuramoyl-L-alanine--D-glutamate ligase [Anaerolineales bacterium]